MSQGGQQRHTPDWGRDLSPVFRPRESARRLYDRLGRRYDLLSMGAERRLQEAGLRLLEARPGERVLEIGPGTGRALKPLAEAVGPEGLVCGVDLSAGMLRACRERLQGAGLLPRVRLIQADAIRLPFEAESFEGVFMSFTLELFSIPDMAALLQECRRVLCPEGRLAVVALSKARDSLVARLYEWFHSVAPSVADCRPIRLQELLQGEGWRVQEAELRSLFGLPVEIVLAGTPSPARGRAPGHPREGGR
jgi:ubiquinone/menaquinone biosynthesis C-methylase UbiE